MSDDKSIFKIQLGCFYLQMPNNLESLRHAKKWIEFFINYLENIQSLEETVNE